MAMLRSLSIWPLNTFGCVLGPCILQGQSRTTQRQAHGRRLVEAEARARDRRQTQGQGRPDHGRRSMQRRAGSRGAVARVGAPTPEGPGRPARRRARGLLRRWLRRAVRTLADIYVAALVGPPVPPGVDRVGALLRRAVRVRHQALLVVKKAFFVHADAEQDEERFRCKVAAMAFGSVHAGVQDFSCACAYTLFYCNVLLYQNHRQLI
jgi:hypothetical protein